jgi:MYXO-CTERM domain-containing protein
MFRKHFKIKRAVLGLAFATALVPVAPAGAATLSTFVDGGPAPVSYTAVTSYQPSYLRYHAVGGPVGPAAEVRSEHSATQAGTVAQQPAAAISERSNGVQGPDPSLVPQVVLSTSSGFDWTDAGVGASTAFGAALLLGLALVLSRRRQDTGLTSA